MLNILANFFYKVNFHYGQRLRTLMEQKNFNVETLALKLGKSPTAVYKDFKKKDVQTRVLKEYCEALGIDIAAVFDKQASVSTPMIDLDKYKEMAEQREDEIIRLNKWLLDREELIRLYKKECERLQQALDECRDRLKEKPDKMPG